MNEEIQIRQLTLEDCHPDLLDGFDRYQDVKKCWRRENGAWVLKDIAFVEQWGDEEKRAAVDYLAKAMQGGGAAFGAFVRGCLVGFASVENRLFGTHGDYVNLEMLHISFGYRGRGLGRRLFAEICRQAKLLGAKKLYISGHSAQETQAFYQALGCVDATEIDPALFEREPCDRHLEYLL